MATRGTPLPASIHFLLLRLYKGDASHRAIARECGVSLSTVWRQTCHCQRPRTLRPAA